MGKPQNPVPDEKREQQREKDWKLIYENMVRSSEKNRNLFIFFLLFMVYAAVIIVPTTDPNSSVKLPILSIDVSLIFFYIVAPILLFAFHFNILYNTHMHLKKLNEFKNWHKEQGEPLPHYLIQPYLIDFASLGKGRLAILLQLFVFLLLEIAPVVLFFAILISFYDYRGFDMVGWFTALPWSDNLASYEIHSPISVLHLAVLTVDFYVLVFYNISKFKSLFPLLYINDSYKPLLSYIINPKSILKDISDLKKEFKSLFNKNKINITQPEPFSIKQFKLILFLCVKLIKLISFYLKITLQYLLAIIILTFIMYFIYLLEKG